MWEFDFSQLKHIEFKDYAVRFLFGGAISVLAALVSQLTNGRIGGIFTAFPAILLASLTIISREDGKHETEEDAKGGIVGAVAFVITAIVLSLTLKLLAGALALLLAVVVWLLCAVGLYVLSYKSQWLHVSRQHPQAPDTK